MLSKTMTNFILYDMTNAFFLNFKNEIIRNL